MQGPSEGVITGTHGGNHMTWSVEYARCRLGRDVLGYFRGVHGKFHDVAEMNKNFFLTWEAGRLYRLDLMTGASDLLYKHPSGQELWEPRF